MAKLRKMLGDIHSPVCIALMGLIETQSKTTLARWTVNYAEEHYLPIFAQACPEQTRLGEILSLCREHLDGKWKLAELKPALRETKRIAQALDGEPTAQAAARAVATACASVQTPTNALGYLFYGCAAMAYDAAGLTADQNTYDVLAEQELEHALASLREVSVENEPNPANIKWGC